MEGLAAPQPVTALRRVGPAMQERLAKLGIGSVVDLLFHLPSRYQDRTRIVPIGSLRPGDHAVVEGELSAAEVKVGRRRMLLAQLVDGTGTIVLRFFYFTAAQQASLTRGTRLRCFGEVRPGATGLEMVHPEYRRPNGDQPPAVEEHLTPIYPTTEGLQQTTLRQLTDQALDLLTQGELPLLELLPAELLPAGGELPLAEALHFLHRPPPDAPLALLADGRHPAQQRLAFEELLAHHLSLRQLRLASNRQRAPALRPRRALVEALLAALPFSLTAAQQRVWGEIADDLAQFHPMMRLVQGDVGSGKTVVAALAALRAVEAEHQAAVMAPTELLAEQHFRNFSHWLTPLGIEVAWLAGKLKGKARKAALERILSGEVGVVVGTHALFQDDVAFQALGLVIVDEQHRFGVHQRLALREKGARAGRQPHQLIMTATPIPRTLAMTAYADLDLSTIDELPPGRTPVETAVLPDSRRDEVVARVAGACAEGRQAYWVCTVIEESELLEAQAAADTAALLQQMLPQLRVGLVHGRLKADEKEQVMAAFKGGELDLLVATTVIEVGVDVPNATLMIIENAERLGLAQLHQLRGRVGRGAGKSHCLLLYHPPLSAMSRSRLAILRESNDGFEIARRDLELRGPGELLGTRQTGLMQLKIADLRRDQALLPAVNRAAGILVRQAPERIPALVRRWVAGGDRYGTV